MNIKVKMMSFQNALTVKSTLIDLDLNISFIHLNTGSVYTMK